MGISGLLPFLTENSAIRPANLDDLHLLLTPNLYSSQNVASLDHKQPISAPNSPSLQDKRVNYRAKNKGNFTFHSQPLAKTNTNIRNGDIGKRAKKPTLVAAVDAYSWLHKGAFGCAEAIYKRDMEAAKTVYVNYALRYVDLLLNHGIKPILIFDGTPLAAKQTHTDSVRRQRRVEARAKADSLMARGLLKQARDYFPRCLDVTFAMAHHLIEACRANDIDYIVAPYEADAQMAYLQRSGLVDIVITEDSDLVVFGCERIFFKLDMHGNGMLYQKSGLLRIFTMPSQLETKDYSSPPTPKLLSKSPLLTTPNAVNGRTLRSSKSLPNIEGSINVDQKLQSSPSLTSSALVNFDFVKFQYMCIMSGCDYLPSLPNVGLGKARKFFSLPLQCKQLRYLVPRMPSYLKMPGLKVPPGYVEQFIAAHRLFLFQTVFDPISLTFRPLNSNVRDLEQLYTAPHQSHHDLMTMIDSILHPKLGVGDDSCSDINAAIEGLCPLERRLRADRYLLRHLVMGNVDVTDLNLPVVDSYCCLNKITLGHGNRDTLVTKRKEIKDEIISIWDGDDYIKIRQHAYQYRKNYERSDDDDDSSTGFDLSSWDVLKHVTLTPTPPNNDHLSMKSPLADSGIEVDKKVDLVDSPVPSLKGCQNGAQPRKRSRYFTTPDGVIAITGRVNGNTGDGVVLKKLASHSQNEISGELLPVVGELVPTSPVQLPKFGLKMIDGALERSPMIEIKRKAIITDENDISTYNNGDGRCNSQHTSLAKSLKEKRIKKSKHNQDTLQRWPSNHFSDCSPPTTFTPEISNISACLGNVKALGSPKFRNSRSKLLLVQMSPSSQLSNTKAKKSLNETGLNKIFSQYKFVQK